MTIEKTTALVLTGLLSATLMGVSGKTATASEHSQVRSPLPTSAITARHATRKQEEPTAPEVDRVPGAEQIVKDLSPGERARIGTVNGTPLILAKDSRGNLSAHFEGQVPSGACTWAVASAVYGMGAAALAAAAASGGLEVAGVFLAPEMLSQLSAVAGSFSAVYNFIGQHVC
ncbi:hypothetical protein [Actinopolyspora mortivallis]|uniref:hypothetical protein n=1 Tax=Actinopolyspora mortivallis TaxID=33906 RepID=UPI0011B281F8|nr:hypothetical protein [Actinopolyspora mortivallis]